MARTLANGRFEVLHLLGEGGMGVVHAARDVERGELIAVKRLRSLGGEALLRFKHEFRALQGLRHPNLATLHELLEDGDTWLFTMDLIDGVDLHSWVGPPPGDPARLRAALAQLGAGLGALHAAGKVHRDIKPSNVLVTGAGRVVLVDFGLVGEVAQKSTAVVGTAAYMAPEQAGPREIGPAADWYAVGCLLYEALTGQLPFDGGVLEILTRKLAGEAPPPSSLRDVPADLDALCVDLLRVDPERRPDAAEVLRRMAATTPTATGPEPRPHPPASGGFVGRTAELAALRDAFTAAARGPVALMVHGESGVGKSALVRQFTSQLSAEVPGVVVLEGRCYERESVRYKALDGVIDALSRYLAKLPADQVAALAPVHLDVLLAVFPVLARVDALVAAAVPGEVRDPGERRQRLLRAVRELFATLARTTRLVVVVDDLQWADADGLVALRELTRPRGGPPLLLIATGRAAADARGLLRGVRELRLGGLDDASSRALAANLAGEAGVGDDTLDAIARESGGHPLFVDELIRHAAERGGDHADRLDDALRARIGRLPDDARALLELLAVAGGPVRHRTLARAAELELGAAVRALDELRRSHLVRTTGARRADTAETFHDRIAAAALGALADPQRRSYHARLAAALAAEPDVDAEALAVHWAAAGKRDRAAVFARQAADEAAADLAFDHAARLYLQVLELGAGLDDGELYARLGDVLAGAGRGAEAAGAYITASDLAPAGAARRLRVLAADQLLRSGRIDDGLRWVQRALGQLGLGYPSTARRALLSLATARVRVRLRGLRFTPRAEAEVPTHELERLDLCWAVSIGLAVVDFVRGADFQARHLVLALRTGEPRRVARSLAAEAAFAAAAGSSAARRVERLLAAARGLAEQHDDAYGAAFAGTSAGIASFLRGHWQLCREQMEQAEVALRDRCVGVHWEIGTAQLFALWSSVQLGDLVPLDSRLDQLLGEARARGDLLSPTHAVVGHASLLALADDDPARARRESADAMARWTSAGFQMPHCFDLWAMAQTDLYEGKLAEATARLAEAWPRVEASMLLQVQMIRATMTSLRGRIALVAGDLRGATAAAKRLEREDAPWIGTMALALRAGLAGARGDVAARGRLLAEAAAGFAAADMALHAAAARWQRGQLLGGSDGAALITAAEQAMRARTVRACDRMAKMLVP